MADGAKPKIRTVADGETLLEQGTAGTDVFLILDGMFVVEVDGEQVAEIGPGAVVGERASLEGGLRTATLRARTRGRVAEVPPDGLDAGALETLAATHRETKAPSRLGRADPLPKEITTGYASGGGDRDDDARGIGQGDGA
jgi:CRP-like cAMP-binding protein